MQSDHDDNTDIATADAPLAEAELLAMAERLELLPLDEAEWIAALFRECRRARAAEAALLAQSSDASRQLHDLQSDLAQIVLDAAEWLRTLWNVGYMGASHFPAEPRSEFPAVDFEDVLKSSLLSRIRQGKRPLPFPPPTRHGIPWHEVVEAEGSFAVEAAVVRDEAAEPLAAVIDGCSDWNVIEETERERSYLVQHAGKGPLYRLRFETEGATLTRQPPTWSCRITARERGGIRSYVLAWPRDGGKTQEVPLHAATWQRAESEALHWVATRFPERYGQVRFERADE